MKIETIHELSIPDIKVVVFKRFSDHRGYFSETFRKSDFANMHDVLGRWKIMQINESYSRKGTIRGLHFQWNPYMGKLVRTVYGHMVDLVLDIRKGSPYYGKIIGYDMQADPDKNTSEWIWVPPGFAHGNMFLEESTIEYFCSGEYSPGCEAGISPLAEDIDWSLCKPEIKSLFDTILQSENLLMTNKDKNGYRMKQWNELKESDNFIYSNLNR
jgi:dTDP-4-dehydrorhamnose 3,5-epimerase